MAIRLFPFLLLFFSLVSGLAQNQRKLDSLRTMMQLDLEHSIQLKVLSELAGEYRDNPDSTIKYGHKLVSLCNKNDSEYLAVGHFYLGQALKDKGSYEQSVNYLFKSLKIKEILGQETHGVEALLASVYGRIEDMEKSSYYYHKVLNNLNQGDKPIYKYAAYNNFGDAFYLNAMYDSAYYYFSKALQTAIEGDMPSFYINFTKGNVGMVNLKLGNLDSAETQLRAFVEFSKPGSDSYLTFKTILSETYFEQGKLNEASEMLLEVVEEAEFKGYKEQMKEGHRLLSELYYEKGLFKESLDSYKSYIAIEDSIKDIETVRRIGDLRTEYEVGQKQAELDLVNAERDKERLITIGISLLAAVLLILGLVILKYYRQKEKTNKELELLNQTKDKFFSIISHDLRGPVSSFFGISRMIKSLVNRQQTEQLLAIADDIDESVDRLSALLDNLLNWAMQQQGNFPNVPEKVDLNEVVEDLIRTLDTMAKGKQIDLQAQIQQPIYLWVDKNTTMTILRNLVNNALKFTPDGGSVTISASKNADQAVIEVIDSGVGIPQEKLKNLFQLQDKKSTYGTSGEKGLGLGLQLVYEFVEMNGGKIEVSSQELVGTTFTVTLPLYDLEEEVIVT